MKSMKKRASKRLDTAPASAQGPKPDGMLTRHDLAKHLRVSTRTVSEWQQENVIPYIKVGKVVLFYWPDVVAHLRQHYRVATAADAAREVA